MAAIDLRSDYYPLARPDVLAAMAAAAAVGGGFDTRDDPFVRALEQLAAEILGKDDALFLPTCSMANQTAIQLFCQRGDGYVAEATSHVIVAEHGAPAALAGATALPIAGRDRQPDVAALEAVLDEPPIDVVPRLLVLENTHTRLGGLPLTVEATRTLAAAARSAGMAVHLDGARLLNACVALGCRPDELAAPADTVSLSLNKGLGAPTGAILAGPRERIREAVKVRSRVGGNWRGAGMLAAGASAALKAGHAHLAADHEHALQLADLLADSPLLRVVPATTRTSIVLLDIDPAARSAPHWIERLAAQGVLALARGRRRIRLVLNAGIRARDVARAADVLHSIGTERTSRRDVQ